MASNVEAKHVTLVVVCNVHGTAAVVQPEIGRSTVNMPIQYCQYTSRETYYLITIAIIGINAKVQQ